jgi:hypothetical protein
MIIYIVSASADNLPVVISPSTMAPVNPEMNSRCLVTSDIR